VEKASFLAVQAYFSYHLGQLNPALSACNLGLRLLKDDLSGNAPNDELVWLKGLIELQRKNLPAANTALAQLRKMLDAGSHHRHELQAIL